MFDLSPDLIALLIPILVVIGVFGTAVASIIIKGKEHELEHKERIIAMEKGIPIPEPPKKEHKPRYYAARAWGFVMTFLGIALFIAISVQVGVKYGVWGLLPLAIGVGLLLSAGYEKKEMERKERDV
ncbi:MAG: hypothetical protein B6D63_02890 [Candidatus Latescibacteria bacterium 4484_7]|nr:MAG: hypothetical protein B6D63_02890 [Candidatus Latescibacteria bacterium 4484_7]RKZ08050.1 MAG: hypothetical protein DRQ05_02165 [bacterium]